MAKLPANQVLQVLAAYRNWYKVLLPDQKEGFVESAAVTAKPYWERSLKDTARLLDLPDRYGGR